MAFNGIICLKNKMLTSPVAGRDGFQSNPVTINQDFECSFHSSSSGPSTRAFNDTGRWIIAFIYPVNESWRNALWRYNIPVEINSSNGRLVLMYRTDGCCCCCCWYSDGARIILWRTGGGKYRNNSDDDGEKGPRHRWRRMMFDRRMDTQRKTRRGTRGSKLVITVFFSSLRPTGQEGNGWMVLLLLF